MFRVFFILLLTLFTCQATSVSYEREFKQIESRYTRMVPHIIKLSDQFGISAELITATIYKESTFKSNAANPKSSARGLMQLTRPTAKAMIKKYGKQLGIRHGANLYDPHVNMKLGVAYLHDVREVVERKIKREATDAEIYLAYKYSPERAVKMIRSRGNVRMVDFYGSAASGNPKDYFHKGRALTVAESKRKVTSGFKQAKAFYGPKIARDVALHRAKEALVASQNLEKHIFKEVLRTYQKINRGEPQWLAKNTKLNQVHHRSYNDATYQAYADVNTMTSGRTYKGIPL